MAAHASMISSQGQDPVHTLLSHDTTDQSSCIHSSYVANEERQEHVTVDIHPADTHPTSSTVPQKSQNPLQIFHDALGIQPPHTPKPSRNWLGRSKTSPPTPQKPKLSLGNKGVYHEVRSCERWTRIRYLVCDFLVVVAMFLQIIVGAAVTAFGAGSVNDTVITVFGAANTALASLLAVLKSKGLPNRLRQDWNVWRELREYIEEKEREIEMIMTGKISGTTEKQIDVWSEIKSIEARYNAVRVTSEANRPDTYVRVPTPALPK
ncbi:hypothetical protein D0Z07_5957 [Hyphodiscus hymeniophilus]|uniref:SMODS and SLOG-associating 2TM effector domain-containing protein n=1 Tax=Hyphodiscus hymeniophilus TaxID=353542 RepID=A0A9P7AW40_9HELO|nr:hypothetical protein D0Z07_5957 [Hyphodiscus hymeniophilus]